MHAPNPDHIVSVVTGALPVHGTVAAVRHIHGGLVVRVTGRTARARATRALTAAGIIVAVDDRHGIIRIPNQRKATPCPTPTTSSTGNSSATPTS